MMYFLLSIVKWNTGKKKDDLLLAVQSSQELSAAY